jgi:hypothetical protein
MGFIFIILFSFSLWLIWVTYFREHFDTGIIEKTELTTIEQLTVSGMNKKEHFHNLDESVFKIARSPSVCMKCHGSYPHSKSNEIRAFLNAHAYFMACEVCHLDEKKRAIATFKWLDDKTGLAMEFFPTQFKAKIVPVEMKSDTMKRLDETSDRRFVEDYLTHRNTLDADQEAAAKVRIHRNVSDSAIVCDDCHTAEKQPYLPYAKLKYTQKRISQIAGTEVTGMIKKYKKFYIPSFLQEESL